MKSVAICGMAVNNRHLANYEPVEVERWAQGGCFRHLDRVHRYFELHTREWIRKRATNRAWAEYIHFLERFKGPIYTNFPEDWDYIPHAQPYPLEATRCLFPEVMPEANPYYLASSLSYMIAMAILEGFEEIKLFGVNMAAKEEYSHQKGSCEYLLGVAHGKGIRVVIPGNSPLLKHPLYAQRPNYRMTIDSLNERLRKLEERKRKLEAELISTGGQIALVEQMISETQGLEDTSPMPKGILVGAEALTNGNANIQHLIPTPTRPPDGPRWPFPQKGGGATG